MGFGLPSQQTAFSQGIMMENVDLSFIQGARGGRSNDVAGIMGMNVLEGGDDLEDDSQDSVLNSHRRSRS